MYFSRRGPEAGLLLQGEPRQKLDQVGAGELPLEPPSRLLVAALEGQDALAEVVERGGIAGSQHLAPQDREVDLDLVVSAELRLLQESFPCVHGPRRSVALRSLSAGGRSNMWAITWGCDRSSETARVS